MVLSPTIRDKRVTGRGIILSGHTETGILPYLKYAPSCNVVRTSLEQVSSIVGSNFVPREEKNIELPIELNNFKI